MPPERHPASSQTLDLEMVRCAFRDDEPAYWVVQRGNLNDSSRLGCEAGFSGRRSGISAFSHSRLSPCSLNSADRSATSFLPLFTSAIASRQAGAGPPMDRPLPFGSGGTR